MIREIIRDPLILAKPGDPATGKDTLIARDLMDTLEANKDRCVGMAANMIGFSKRIIAVRDGIRKGSVMDTRFSSAIHMLILISEAETPMTSERIAESVGTNASYIRKITGLLKKKGILTSRQGISGFVLAVPPAELTIYSIYQAIYEAEHIRMFDLHRNSNDKCIVGKHIQPVLSETFRGIEEKAEQELKRQTLADCIHRMREEISGG